MDKIRERLAKNKNQIFIPKDQKKEENNENCNDNDLMQKSFNTCMNLTLKFNFKPPSPQLVIDEILQNNPQLEKKYKNNQNDRDNKKDKLGGGLDFKTVNKQRLSLSKFKTRDTSAKIRKYNTIITENSKNKKFNKNENKDDDDLLITPHIDNLITLGFESMSGNINLGKWVTIEKKKKQHER